MAIIPSLQFPGQIIAPNANYPLGEPKSVTSPGAGDGTPWSKPILADYFGFFQKLLNDSGVVPSGVPDTVLASDYYDALLELTAVPVGSSTNWLGDGAPPAGWLVMDGSSVAEATYPRLFSVIGDQFGTAGAGFFNLPDTRGYFLRHLDSGAGNDPGVEIQELGDLNTSTIITNIDFLPIEIGMSVTGPNIPAGTFVVDIIPDNTNGFATQTQANIEISQAATATVAGVLLTFSNRTDRGDGTAGDVVGTRQGDGTKKHNHPLWAYSGGLGNAGPYDNNSFRGIPGGVNVGGDNWLGGGLADTEINARMFRPGEIDTRPKNMAVVGIIKY